TRAFGRGTKRCAGSSKRAVRDTPRYHPPWTHCHLPAVRSRSCDARPDLLGVPGVDADPCRSPGGSGVIFAACTTPDSHRLRVATDCVRGYSSLQRLFVRRAVYGSSTTPRAAESGRLDQPASKPLAVRSARSWSGDWNRIASKPTAAAASTFFAESSTNRACAGSTSCRWMSSW
ncbi:MAG: hypothetical protein QOJ62_1265, partial [Actinomycetota bacterium]|nr:hypothetical protein [Actinomycetota bacterium]